MPALATMPKTHQPLAMSNMRPTLWRSQVHTLLCHPDDPRFAECPDDQPHCITPLPTEGTEGDHQAPKKKRQIDQKMQVEWWEDMLNNEKSAVLQSWTEQFLGKQVETCATNDTGHSTTGLIMHLPPMLQEPLMRPEGEDPIQQVTTGVRHHHRV
jgi:hypothetical protein